MRLARAAALVLACAVPAASLHAQSAGLDSLDAFVRAQMARRQITGLTLAIIQDGRIIVARGYGVTDETTRAPVTPATLFQAGSISKPVAALGALHLVEAGRLSLDADVNASLKSWRVPENGFTTTEQVTLRRILSHSAGLTVHGFPGYAVTDPMPSLVQVLNGTPPANTPPIRVDTTPGAILRYSGGGFTVMQQMMIDVAGKSFPRFMQEAVLGPIGMTGSSYEQPQPKARARLTASGYYTDRSPVRGRWHLYPEMAAAGLWTTATDLAKFAIEVQATLAGRGHGVISPAMTRQYLTEQEGGYGLGVGLSGDGATLAFSHGGRDEGFDAYLIAFAETGQGAVILINANDNSRFVGRMVGYIARTWGWPESAAPGAPAATEARPIAAARLDRYAGHYEFRENQMVTLLPNRAGTGLEGLTDGLPDEEFLSIDSVTFGSTERGMTLRFPVDSSGAVAGVVWRPGADPARERLTALVTPLPSARTPAADPDPSLTARIVASLQAIAQGGALLANAPDIPAGTKADFGGGVGGALDGMTAPVYLGEEDVSARQIHRHGSDLARVRSYRITTKAGERYLLVHLTAEGEVADYDVVER